MTRPWILYWIEVETPGDWGPPRALNRHGSPGENQARSRAHLTTRTDLDSRFLDDDDADVVLRRSEGQ